MSLFGTKKEVHVASSPYNLAGDELLRPNYLKSLVIRNVLANTETSIADSITNGYLYGPGMDLRRFINWSFTHYPSGQLSGSMSGRTEVELTAIAPYISHGSDEEVWMQQADVGLADYGRWVEQYLLLNDPAELDKNWTANISKNSPFNITITKENNTSIIFTPSGFNQKSNYIYSYYVLVKNIQYGTVTTGTLVNIGNSTAFPPTTGYTLYDTVSVPNSMNLDKTTTVVKTYSDGRPSETTTNTVTNNSPYNVITREYRKDTFLGSTSNEMKSRRDYYFQFEDKSLSSTTNSSSTTNPVPGSPGVTVTTTTTIVEQILINNNSYRYDQQINITESWGDVRMFIYRIGSGISELDNSLVDLSDYGKFYPIIPVRHNNEFISETYKPEIYAEAKKAYKKATGGKYDKLIDNISDNEKLDDLDYAFVVFGVSLNVRENACRKYIYNFFKKLSNDQLGGSTSYQDWLDKVEYYQNTSEEWIAWRNAQSDPSSALYGTPEPFVAKGNPTLLQNNIRMSTEGDTDTDYDINLSWAYITESFHTGLGKVGAKKGDYWLQNEGFDLIPNPAPASNSGENGYEPAEPIRIYKIAVYHQLDANNYSKLLIVDLLHTNYVWTSNAVRITGRDALLDEDESGFIIPLHNETYREMSLVDATQMSTACIFIVFNCYEIVKIKWYQRGFFKVIIVIFIAIITAVFSPLAPGLLGPAAKLGTTLGFSGVTAAIVGSIVNAIAALVVATVIEQFTIAAFGDVIGRLLSVITNLVIVAGLTSMNSFGSFNMNWNNLMKVDNLTKMTDVLGRGAMAYIQGQSIELQEEANEYAAAGQREINRIQQQYFETFGLAGGAINPLMFTNPMQSFNENSDTFLSRTLMTGTDIAEMTHSMINQFAELTIKLPTANG